MLTRTNLLGESSADAHGTGVWTPGAFTPPNNSLLVIFVLAGESAGSSTDVGATLSVSGGGWTYTPQITIDDTTYWASGLRVFTAPVGIGASMQLTFDCGTYNIHKYRVVVVAYEGYETDTPVGAMASGWPGVTDGAETLALSASPASDSEVVAAIATTSVAASNSVVVGTGWTEQYQVTGAAEYGGLQAQTRTGSTSTSVGWDDVSTDAGGLYENLRAAIEIKAAAGGGGPTNHYLESIEIR